MTSQIPLEALALPGEQGDTLQPAQGDEVEAQVTLRIDSVEGDSASVTILAINGAAVAGADTGMPGKGAAPTTLEEDEDDLDAEYARYADMR